VRFSRLISMPRIIPYRRRGGGKYYPNGRRTNDVAVH